jgi:signal transduction histidine kinase
MAAWWTLLRGDRLRSRLLGAFAALFVGTVALAAVGFWGMQRTQRELHDYDTEVLPQIARTLEIAERISRLAATAPTLADAQNRDTLQSNADVARNLLDEIRERSNRVDARGRLAARMEPLLQRGQGDFVRLTELTQQRQGVHERLLRQMEALEGVGASLRSTQNEVHAALLLQLWSSLVLATQTASPPTLGRIEADAEALLDAAHRKGLFDGATRPIAERLQALALGPEGVLALRRELLELDLRRDALVTLTQSNADLLSDIVAAEAGHLRETTQTRSALVHDALTSGKTGLLLIALLCIGVSAVSAAYVHHLVGQVEQITGVMSRLAAGDTAQSTPATRRHDEIGALARTFEVFRDNLVAKQQLVAELRAQGELLSAVHDSMNDGLAVFDEAGRLRLWNEALVAMLKRHGLVFAPGEPLKALVARLPADTRWRTPAQADWQALDRRQAPWPPPQHVELQLPGPRLYDLRSQAMPDGGSVSLVTDLTERRAMEMQLQHATRLDMLGRLTGGVAHDFHNHLGTIVGTLGLLQDSAALSEADRLRLARAQRAAERATALTRRLLAFARRQALEAEWVEVDSMIEEMADLIEYSAGPQVQVQLALGSGDAAVYLDRSQLENALLNLVINSAAAMPSGGQLTLRTLRRHGAEDAADELVIEVTDTGCGIPEDLQDKVFEPFFTTKQGGGTGGEGSGLGLSIVHGFVHQSGGRVSLASQVGEGTTVSLHFPVADVRLHTLPAAQTALTAPEAAGPETPRFAGQRVLLVDDDEAFRATVADMLVQAGCRVQAAGTPEEALAALEAGALPDMLLSDVRLADGADGRQLAAQVARRWPALPIGLMSGVPRSALEAGGATIPWPFTMKPFDRAQLLRWLGDVAAQAAPVA